MTRMQAQNRDNAPENGGTAVVATDDDAYALDSQVGFLLRQASQRHRAIFARMMIDDLTPRQWATLAKLHETGPCSQNLLGRRTAMDAATIKGVVDRLTARDLVTTREDASDSRRRTIVLSAKGEALVASATAAANAITRETLAPLSIAEQATLARLLAKIS